MLELPLDDRQRDALVRHLDCVRVPQLVGRDAGMVCDSGRSLGGRQAATSALGGILSGCDVSLSGRDYLRSSVNFVAA